MAAHSHKRTLFLIVYEKTFRKPQQVMQDAVRLQHRFDLKQAEQDQ